MADARPVFNQINLVVNNLAAMVEFTPTIEPFDRHHRTFADDNIVDGFDFDLDSQAFVLKWNEGWPPGRTGPVFGFQVASNEAVDDLYHELTNAGYEGQQPPWDGFMGARYAVVTDPDGNAVGLMGPIDPAQKRMPPDPEG